MAGTLGRRAILAVYSLLIVVPLFVVLSGSFKSTKQLFDSPFAPPSSLSPSNYKAVLTDASMATAFVNSTVVTLSAVVITLAVGSLAAYGLARIPGWRGLLVYGFLVLGMAVPAQSNMIPQYVLFQSLGLLDSRLGLILIEVVATLPVAVFIMTGFMRTLPRELFEARLDRRRGAVAHVPVDRAAGVPAVPGGHRDLPVRHPVERPALPAALHPRPGEDDPAPGAAQLPG